MFNMNNISTSGKNKEMLVAILLHLSLCSQAGSLRVLKTDSTQFLPKAACQYRSKVLGDFSQFPKYFNQNVI